MVINVKTKITLLIRNGSQPNNAGNCSCSSNKHQWLSHRGRLKWSDNVCMSSLSVTLALFICAIYTLHMCTPMFVLISSHLPIQKSNSEVHTWKCELDHMVTCSKRSHSRANTFMLCYSVGKAINTAQLKHISNILYQDQLFYFNWKKIKSTVNLRL